MRLGRRRGFGGCGQGEGFGGCGEVEQAGRGSRIMRFSKMTLTELDAYIQRRERDLEQAQASEAGTPRRRAIGTWF